MLCVRPLPYDPRLLQLANQYMLGCGDRAQYVVDVARARCDYQPPHAKVCITPRQIGVEFSFGRDAYFDFVEVAPACRAGVADAADAIRGCFEIQSVAVPAVAQPRGAAERMRGLAAEDGRRMRLLHRTRLGAHTAERKVTSAELRAIHRPQRLHRRERLLGALALVIERHRGGIELEFEVADADAENEPAARQDVR